jgi:hypothetical protein
MVSNFLTLYKAGLKTQNQNSHVLVLKIKKVPFYDHFQLQTTLIVGKKKPIVIVICHHQPEVETIANASSCIQSRREIYVMYMYM